MTPRLLCGWKRDSLCPSLAMQGPALLPQQHSQGSSPPNKHSISEEGPCSDPGSAFLRRDRVPRCPGGRGWRHATPMQRVCFPWRAELMALLCRAGTIIFWEEGGLGERDRPRKRPRKLPLLNSRLWLPGDRGCWPCCPAPGLSKGLLQRGPCSQWDCWVWGGPMGPDLGSEVPCSDLWVLVAPLPALAPKSLQPSLPFLQSPWCSSVHKPPAFPCHKHLHGIKPNHGPLILVFIWGGGS